MINFTARPLKSFRPPFSKGGAGQGRVALVASAEATALSWAAHDSLFKKARENNYGLPREVCQ